MKRIFLHLFICLFVVFVYLFSSSSVVFASTCTDEGYTCVPISYVCTGTGYGSCGCSSSSVWGCGTNKKCCWDCACAAPTNTPAPAYTCTQTAGQWCTDFYCGTDCVGGGTCASGYICCQPCPTDTPTPTPTPAGCDCQPAGHCQELSGSPDCSYGYLYQTSPCVGCTSPNNAWVYDKCIGTRNGLPYTETCSGSYCGINASCSVASCNAADTTNCWTIDITPISSLACGDGTCPACYIRTKRIYCYGLGSLDPCTSTPNDYGTANCTHCGDVCVNYSNFVGTYPNCSTCVAATATPEPAATNTPTPTPTPTPLPGTLTARAVQITASDTSCNAVVASTNYLLGTTISFNPAVSPVNRTQGSGILTWTNVFTNGSTVYTVSGTPPSLYAFANACVSQNGGPWSQYSSGTLTLGRFFSRDRIRLDAR